MFLGLDCSTQSLSAIAIENKEIVYEKTIHFDTQLPQYKTKHGVLPHSNPLVKHSTPLLFAAALDQLFAQMVKDKVPLEKIVAISGAAQQHGSVYLNKESEKILAQLDPMQSLAENLRDIFSRPTCPIWMDSSTTSECEEIRSALGGAEKTASLTGSDAYERFTAPQIRKFYKDEEKAYDETAHIALISSFLASLIAGKIAAIDFGDGSGMNLMDIHKKEWSQAALAATAPRLDRKLPRLAAAGTLIGPVSPYFVQKYGLNPHALALVWTGDNPASVVGLGLTKPGHVTISLGTSDTFMGTMEKCRTNVLGHLFCSPAGGYFAMICFKNGSLAREQIRTHYHIPDWETFGSLVESTPVGNRGGLLLPWFEPEIVPRVHTPGIHRLNLAECDAPANCRAVLEAQMLSMRLHSQWMETMPQQIFATGGASHNPQLLHIMADVMNCPVVQIVVAKSAALGAALIAAQCFEDQPKPMSAVQPNKEAVMIYNTLIEKYADFERVFKES